MQVALFHSNSNITGVEVRGRGEGKEEEVLWVFHL